MRLPVSVAVNELLERERQRPLSLPEIQLTLDGVDTMARLRLRFLRWLIAGGRLTEFPPGEGKK